MSYRSPLEATLAKTSTKASTDVELVETTCRGGRWARKIVQTSIGMTVELGVRS